MNDKKKNYYKKLKAEQNKVVHRETGFCWAKKKGVEMFNYYGQRHFTIFKNMKTEEEKRKNRNFGIAFIAVHSVESTQRLITSLSKLKRDMKYNNSALY